MLRGVQTPGELKQRTERLHPFADLAAVQETLERLIERGVVERLERRPGQKEERYRQLLGGEEPPATTVELPATTTEPAAGEDSEEAPAPPPPSSRSPVGPVEERFAAIEREVAELREQVTALREALGE